MDDLEAGVPAENRLGFIAGEAMDARRAILRPGENVWRVERSVRASVLVDGIDYFSHLESALRKARRSITILGWDFDHRIRLRPDEPDSPQLGDFLRSLVEATPELEIRVLVWSVAVVHAPSEPTQLLLGAEWEKHPRISVRLDTFHPFYAAHHQKIVCVDEAVAFVGGMDLTVRRWDRRPHEIDNPARVSPEGAPYLPIHDLQMVVDGPAARAIGDLVRQRWRSATGQTLATLPDIAHDPWPDGLTPDFTDELVGVSRTLPLCGAQTPVSEIEALTHDCLLAARRSIYIEAQYMTATFVGDILAAHLAAPQGPEIMIIMTHESRGLAERFVMGSNRDRLIRRLKKADRYNRLRVCYPIIRDNGATSQVMVHSKLMVVDDRLLRVGSANLNNRSMGLDSECDLVIEGTRKDTQRAIEGIKWRLLGEHLDAAPEEIAATAQSHGSMVGAIDALNNRRRGMACFEAMTTAGPVRPVACTGLLDPTRPFEPFWFLRRKKLRT